MNENNINHILLLYSQNNAIENLNLLEGRGIQLTAVKTIKEALLFFLDHSNTSAFILEPFEDNEQNINVLSIIYKFNEYLPVYIIEKNEIQNKSLIEKINKNIHWIKTLESLRDKQLTYQNKRKHYRVNWPLTLIFSDNFNFDVVIQGRALSLSLGGVFVQTHELKNIVKDKTLFLKIMFTDFSFLAEGKVVRVENNGINSAKISGFAVEFYNVTEATRNCINRIINDKVINRLFKEINVSHI